MCVCASHTLECSFVIVRQAEDGLGLSLQVESCHSYELNTMAVVQPSTSETTQKKKMCDIYSSLEKS